MPCGKVPTYNIYNIHIINMKKVPLINVKCRVNRVFKIYFIIPNVMTAHTRRRFNTGRRM